MPPDFRKIVEQIARQHGVTPEEVYQGMQEVIDEAYADPNPVIHAR